jgi:hypothetical protein
VLADGVGGCVRSEFGDDARKFVTKGYWDSFMGDGVGFCGCEVWPTCMDVSIDRRGIR